MTVRISHGSVLPVRIGAALRNGSVIIRRGDEILLSDHVGDEPSTVLTTTPVELAGATTVVGYEFNATGEGPWMMRAVWQPEGSQVDLPLPVTATPLLSRPEIRGRLAVTELNCVQCHSAESEARRRDLSRLPAPQLGTIGARARPSWIRAWLQDPQEISPRTRMPAPLDGVEPALRGEMLADLTHFLVSMGGPLDAALEMPTAEAIETGRVLYHEIGCMACHGPLEPLASLPGGISVAREPIRVYTPLAEPAWKYTVDGLAAFLADPVSFHPSGRMPDLMLTDEESRAVASYLVDRFTSSPMEREIIETFEIDPERIDRGRSLFQAVGCANCHELGPGRSAVSPTVVASPLEGLATGMEGNAATGGCIDAVAQHGMPHYILTDSKREAVAAFLAELPHHRSENVPLDDLAIDLLALNCTACHEYRSEPGPEAAIADFLTWTSPDAVDLTNVGIRRSHEQLTGAFERHDRGESPSGLRMPFYGDRWIDELPRLFLRAAGAPEFSASRSRAEPAER